MRVRVDSLIGRPLNWAVAALVEGWTEYEKDDVDGHVFRRHPRGFHVDWHIDDNPFDEDWSLAGPLIQEQMEKHGFDLWQTRDHKCYATYERGLPDSYMEGPTPLVAAMRCIVRFYARDYEINIPDDLVPG